MLTTIEGERGNDARTLRLGPTHLDGAHERRERHLAVLRRAQRALGGPPLGQRRRWRRRGQLRPLEVLRGDHLTGIPNLRPDARHRRHVRRGSRGGLRRRG